MIEDTINNLTAAVDRLTAVLKSSGDFTAVKYAAPAAVPVTVVPATPPAAPETVEVPAPAAPTKFTRDTIRRLGKDLIARDGDTKRWKTILSEAGFTTVSEIPEDAVDAMVTTLEGVLHA